MEEIREEDEMKDFVDSATFGTIVHEVMQQIYDAVPEKNGKRLVEKSFLDSPVCSLIILSCSAKSILIASLRYFLYYNTFFSFLQYF